MYKKRKNYKSLFNKIKKKGNWHFDPSKKSKDAKYLGRIKLSSDIVSGAIKSVEKSPLVPAVQLYKKDLINKAYEKTPVAWGKVDNIQAGYNASNTLFKQKYFYQDKIMPKWCKKMEQCFDTSDFHEICTPPRREQRFPRTKGSFSALFLMLFMITQTSSSDTWDL